MSAWERRPLPCVTGYNQCAPSGPTFVVEYHSGDDTLTITADESLFDTADSLNYQSTSGTGSISGIDFSHAGNLITIENASTHFTLPTDITQLDVFDPGPTLIGIWTGTVHIDAPLDPADYPLLTGIYSPAVNQVAFTGLRFQTATAGEAYHGYVRLESYATGGCLDGPKMSVYLDGTPQSNGWVLVTYTDTLIVLENPLFSTCTPDDAAPNFTVNGISLDAPNYGTPPGDGYYFWEPWGVTYSCEIDGLHPLP